jgi:hypothetical protein
VTTPLASTSDVADIWRPLSDAELLRVNNLIEKASAKLRHACPFNIDSRVDLFYDDPTNPAGLDPQIVADVVATIVKRFLVNVEGFASTSESVGPFTRSGTFVNRYDKTGSDVRGAIQVIDSDIDQLRPAVPTSQPSTIHMRLPRPELVDRRGVGGACGISRIIADSGVE